MAAKVSKASVNYRRSRSATRKCRTCAMFRGPAGCTLVKGLISRGDVCDRWAAK